MPIAEGGAERGEAAVAALAMLAGAAAATAGGATWALNRSKNASAICLAEASIRRAPSWAILPPTWACTS